MADFRKGRSKVFAAMKPFARRCPIAGGERVEKKGKVQKTERLLGKLTAAAGHVFLVGD